MTLTLITRGAKNIRQTLHNVISHDEINLPEDTEGVPERTGVTNVQHWFNKTTPNALWFNRSDVIN